MIEYDSKQEPEQINRFLSRIAGFVSMGDRTIGDWQETEDLWYLGGGYWRAKAVRENPHDYTSRFLGVRLINPDKTPLQLVIVERAACLCLLGRYKGPEIDFKA